VASDDLLGEAVGELYQADPEEFTRRRGELAAAARSAGQAAVARQIAGLRKPTRSAWMINRLVRSDPEAVARLATLGEELRAAELSGDGARMRDSSQARRELIAALVPRALAASGEHNPPAALREEITATFSAALADPEVAEQIQHATLLRPARRVGFGTVQPPELALVPPPRAARPAARPARKPTATAPGKGRRRTEAEPERRRAEAEAERERRRAEAEAERERRRAEAEVQRERRRARAEAERTLADANRAAQAARQAEQQQHHALQRLEQQLTEARRRLREASAEARRAEAARRRAQRALDRLED
jgi:flagellar biosynthesis GTPase FlhF